MKITVESTSRIVTVNGVDARIWEGYTESGIPVYCCITRIAVPKGADASQFERELEECRPPSLESAQVFPTRMIL